MSTKTYQWIKGEKAGNVVKSDGTTIMEGNIEFIVFGDGSRCNTTLLGDYIMEIASDHQDDLILLNEVAPVPVQRVIKNDTPQPKPEPVKVKQSQQSPVDSLLLGAKKKKQKVLISVDVDVPTPDLLKVVADSFEDGEKHISNYLKSSLDSDKIKDQIVEHIMSTVFVKEPKTKRKNERVQSS
jgi:hypothetical protein